MNLEPPGVGQRQAQNMSLIEVRVADICSVAAVTNVYELQLLGGEGLPTFEPGAHIDVHLPNGLIRQYSLTVAEDYPESYFIAVKRQADGLGGSCYIHDRLSIDDTIQISAPRNNFLLHETNSLTVLIAGGIGITPIWCMVQRLEQRRKPWKLHYACRSRAEAAFRDALEQYPAVHFHFDDENAGQFLDVARIVAEAAEDAHLYCCGPMPMLKAFENAAAGRPGDHVHVEYFTARQEAARTGGFVVELARSGQTFEIPEGKTILEVLIGAGMDIPFSCEQGICGTCETRVIAGLPEHRDAILSEEEQASNATVMICCAGCKSVKLVLDL